jgi:ribosomal subunit interface protein
MDILIQSTGFTVTPDLQSAIEAKVGRVVQYAPRAVRARVNLRRVTSRPSPRQFIVKVMYEVPGSNLTAEDCNGDPLTAIDLVSEKIERRLRKRKTELLARRKARKSEKDE